MNESKKKQNNADAFTDKTLFIIIIKDSSNQQISAGLATRPAVVPSSKSFFPFCLSSLLLPLSLPPFSGYLPSSLPLHALCPLTFLLAPAAFLLLVFTLACIAWWPSRSLLAGALLLLSCFYT